jgi:hypothetical protein
MVEERVKPKARAAGGLMKTSRLDAISQPFRRLFRHKFKNKNKPKCLGFSLKQRRVIDRGESCRKGPNIPLDMLVPIGIEKQKENTGK